MTTGSRGSSAPKRLAIAATAVLFPLLLAGCDMLGAVGIGAGPEESPEPESAPAAADETPAPTTVESTPADEAESGSDEPAGANKGFAHVETPAGSWTFGLTMCHVSDTDVLVHGPGENSATGEVAYLDIDFFADGSSMSGGLAVELGVDEQFVTSDNSWTSDIHGEGGYSLELTDYGLLLKSEYRFDGSPAGTGYLVVDCTGQVDLLQVEFPGSADDVPGDEEPAAAAATSCDWDKAAHRPGVPDIPNGQAGDLMAILPGVWQHTHFDVGNGWEELDTQDIRYVFPDTTQLIYCQHVPGITEHAEASGEFTWEGDTIVLPTARYEVATWDANTMIWINARDSSYYVLQRR